MPVLPDLCYLYPKSAGLKRVIVSVINDLATDQRVDRTCTTLHEMGYEVLLVGRKLKHSMPLPEKPYRMHRMRLIFTRGAAFYAEYNFRLFLFLLFRRVDVLHSNDLDTLAANYLVSVLRRKPVVYDSHEYFTGVPELEHNPFAKRTWKRIESCIVPKLDHCFTVNKSIAGLFREDYGKDFHVMRNVPKRMKETAAVTRKELGMPEDKRILVLQGSGINIDRGSEELVRAMALLDDVYLLYIIGSGDVIPVLKEMIPALSLQEKVKLTGKLPYAQLLQYTRNADAGITVDKNTNINYRFSLPNKIFDYIQAGIPVLASDLVEIRRVIETYDVGVMIPEVTPEAIAQGINRMFADQEAWLRMKANTVRAAAELNWEEEQKVLVNVYRQIHPDAGR